MKNRESDITKFHNQREPDFNPENGVVLSPESEEYDKYILFKMKEEAGLEKKAELAQLKEVLALVKNARLIVKAKNDPEQKKLLRERKNLAKEKIREVLNDISEYLAATKDLACKRKKYEKEEFGDRDNLKFEMENADGLRKTKHDRLVSDLTSAIRFIAHTFGNIDPEAIEKWNEKREERGQIIIEVERVNLPRNVICPDGLNLRDRKQVGNWALKLAQQLTEIKKEEIL